MVALKSFFFLSGIVSIILAQEKVIVGYFSDWDNVDPKTIDLSKVTHINYSFGTFDEKNLKPKVGNPKLLSQVVEAAHAKQAKVLVSLGGWEQSKSFSPVVKDPTSRSQFAKNINEFIQENKLDGIDIDWEHPGTLGAGNQFDAENDTKNYLLFLRELRKVLGTKLITAAVSGELFVGAKDVTEFGKVFDFINLMAYDFNMSTSETSGPNAGLDFEAGKAIQMSVKSSVKTWISGGIPANKLVLGVPFYGTMSKVDKDLNGSTGMYANRVKDSGKAIRYSEIISSALSSYKQAINGYVRYFDSKSQTPWLFNKSTKTIINYDDPESLKFKAQFAISQGLRGVMIWDMNQDSNSELLNSLQFIRGGKPIPEQPAMSGSPQLSYSIQPSNLASLSLPIQPSEEQKVNSELKIQSSFSNGSNKSINAPTPIPEPLVKQRSN